MTIAPRPSVRGADALPQHALQAIDLTKRYGGGVLALRAISLDVPWGSITGLVGPNAAGKSTLLNTWVGFERPTSGSTRVAGLDPGSHRLARSGSSLRRPRCIEI